MFWSLLTSFDFAGWGRRWLVPRIATQEFGGSEEKNSLFFLQVFLREQKSPHRSSRQFLKCGRNTHWEIKGRFRERVVLANVPSFRFSFRWNIRQNHPFGNHPFVNTQKAHWDIKGRFPKGWFWRMYPHSGFRSGDIRQNHPFGNHPFANPRNTLRSEILTYRFFISFKLIWQKLTGTDTDL